MKKVSLYILTTLFVTSNFYCSKSFLDRRPRDVVSDLDAYGSESGLEALTVTLYNDMQTEDLNFTVATEAGYVSTTTDEAVRSYPWGAINDPIVGNWYGNWNYSPIRRVNDFIEKIPATTIPDALKARFIAEGRFIRAFHYFALVKRYGGVPLVTKSQQFTGDNIKDLALPRNKEQEIYDFIATELDACLTDLPESYNDANKFRITRYAALALKSRAMLYAASIAKYASVRIDGLVGIPATEANKYWQKSMDAAKQIIDSKKFALFTGEADKVANFQKLFLTAPATEAIFTKAFASPEKAHSFDFYNAPQSFRVDYGCATNPTVEMVEEFEYKDGSPGKLRVSNPDGTPIVYANPRDLFKDKDPRLLATIMTPFEPWQGGVVEIRRGVIAGGVKYTSEVLTEGYPDKTSTFKRVGKDGPTTTNDPTKTGFYIKKFMDPVNRVPFGRSVTPWMVFRYGETLLNYAEAAAELGNTGAALEAINAIRKRAGIVELTSVTLDQVRHERKVELAFENHRLWDIRRWRIATTVLNNTQFRALYPWVMWQNGTPPENMSYTFEIVPVPKNARTFPEKLYYEPVPQGNPVYVQNPFY